MNAFRDLPACKGSSRLPAATTPAIPQLEFNSQGKLDLPLVIRQLSGDLACTRSNRLREWANVTSVAVEHCSAQVIAAEVSMIEDVEEFSAELQQAGFSQKP